MGRRVRAHHGIVLARGGRARVHLGLVGQDRRPGGVEARVTLVEDVLHGLVSFDDARVQDFLCWPLVAGSGACGDQHEAGSP